MPRLPVVGSDNGTWGTILNDFLAAAHNADGSLVRGTEITNATNHLTDPNAHGGRPPQTATFSLTGALAVVTGTGRFYFNRACTIVSVRIAVNTPSAGASIIVDVNKNATTIFTTQGNRPTLAAGANTVLSGTPDITTMAQGDYLSIDIDQIGSTTAGSDLSVMVEYRVN